ncbi:hypothetical protein QO004_003515 [Rhizobium mesoamericanum]|nr:hypothetical protein [Rhizobium mesoamericanum]
MRGGPPADRISYPIRCRHRSDDRRPIDVGEDANSPQRGPQAGSHQQPKESPENAGGGGTHSANASMRKAFTSASSRNPPAPLPKTCPRTLLRPGWLMFRAFVLAGGVPTKVGKDTIGAIGRAHQAAIWTKHLPTRRSRRSAPASSNTFYKGLDRKRLLTAPCMKVFDEFGACSLRDIQSCVRGGDVFRRQGHYEGTKGRGERSYARAARCWRCF